MRERRRAVVPAACTVVAALLLGVPARAQHIYLDSNGDGIRHVEDVLAPGANTVNVYLQTDKNADQTPATCQGDAYGASLDIYSYEIILHRDGPGSLAYGSWVHNDTDLPGYAELRPTASGSDDFSVSYSLVFGAVNAPGLYRLGSVVVTVTGNQRLSLATSTPLGSFSTSFHSTCPGQLLLGIVYLGVDFADACGTSLVDATNQTTWGAIKRQYR